MDFNLSFKLNYDENKLVNEIDQLIGRLEKSKAVKLKVGLESAEIKKQLSFVEKAQTESSAKAANAHINNLKRVEREIGRVQSEMRTAFSLGGDTSSVGKQLSAIESNLSKTRDAFKRGSIDASEFSNKMGQLELKTIELSNALKQIKSSSTKVNLLSNEDSTRSIKALETIFGYYQKLQSIESKGVASNVKDKGVFAGLSGITQDLKEFESAVRSGAMSQEHFDQQSARFSLSIKKIGDSMNQLVSVQKMLGADNLIDDKSSKKYYDASAQLEKQINVISKLREQLYNAAPNSDKPSIASELNKQQWIINGLKKSLESGTLSYKKYSDSITQAKHSLTALGDRMKSFPSAKKMEVGSEENNKAISQTIKLLDRVRDSQERWTKAQTGSTSGNYNGIVASRMELEKLVKDLEAGKLSAHDFQQSLSKIKFQYEGDSSAIRAAGRAETSMTDKFFDATKIMLPYLSGAAVISTAIRESKELIATSIRLDDAMTQLKIVTNETADAYDRYSKSAYETAKALGASTADIVEATTTYARLGYSLAESTELASKTAMLQNVGNIGVSEAQDAITSIMKAFSEQYDYTQIETIMDRLVITGNQFPISVAQIAEGMTNASATMAAAGNDFEQTVALLTAANTTIQNAARASTGLRTIAARIRNTKINDDDDMEGLTTAKYEEAVGILTRYKVALTDIQGEYYSTYEILQNIAAAWDDMSSMEQAALATTLAGTRIQDIFYSIIGQFKEAEDAMVAMDNSAGMLQSSYSEYLESTTAHVGSFKAAVDELAASMFKAGTMNFFVDLGRGAVEFITPLAKANMLIPALVISFATIISLKRQYDVMSKNDIAKSLANNIVNDVQNIKKYEDQLKSLSYAEKFRVARNIEAMHSQTDLGRATAESIKSTAGLSNVTRGLGSTMQAAGSSIKSAWTAMSSLNKAMLIVSVAIPIITGISSAMKKASERSSELAENIKSLNSEIASISSEQARNRISIDDNIDRFAELSKGVNQYGKNMSLTKEEYKEFISLNNQVASMIPALNSGITDQGLAVLDLSYNYDTLRESISKALEEQEKLANKEMTSKVPELLKNANAQAGIIRKEIDAVNAALEYNREARAGKTSPINSVNRNAINQYIEMAKSSGNMALMEEIMDRYSSIPDSEVFVQSVLGDDDIQVITGAFAAKLEYLNNEIADRFRAMSPAFSAMLQTEMQYIGASKEMQDVYKNLFNAIDFSTFKIEDADDLQKVFQTQIFDVFRGAEDEITRFVNSINAVKERYKSDDISFDEMYTEIEGIIRLMSNRDATGEFVLSEEMSKLFNLPPNLPISVAVDVLTRGLNEAADAANGAGSAIQSALDVNDENWFKGNIEVMTEEFKAKSTIESAISNQNKTGSILISDLAAINELGSEYSNLLREENGLLVVNEEAYRELLDVKREEREEALRASIAELELQDTDGANKRIQQAEILLAALGSIRAELEATSNIDNTISSLDELEKVSSVLETIRQEMALGGEVSEETMRSVASLGSEYVDMLYREGDAVRANVDGFIDLANAKREAQIVSLQSEIDELREVNLEIERQITLLSSVPESEMDYAAIEELNFQLAENNNIIEQNQMLLSYYPSLFGEATIGAEALRDSIYSFNSVADEFTRIKDEMTQLADIQYYLADGFTISAEKALEFARIYPEILANAELAADGQITLNEAAVNSFIDGKEQELRTDADGAIAKLEVQKTVYQAQINFLKAQLEASQKAAQAGANIDYELQTYRVKVASEAINAIIQGGGTATEANAEAARIMGLNANELSKVYTSTASTLDRNMSTAATAMASNIQSNASASAKSMDGLTTAAHNTARAVAGAGSGTVQGSTGTFRGGGALSNGPAKLRIAHNDVPILGAIGGETPKVFVPKLGLFNQNSPVVANLVNGQYTGNFSVGQRLQRLDSQLGSGGISRASFEGSLMKQIADLEKSMSMVDGQIALLRALQDRDLGEFVSDAAKKAREAAKSAGKSPSGKSAKDPKSSGSSAKKPKSSTSKTGADKSGAEKAKEEAMESINYFELMYKYKNHMLTMEAEDVRAYLYWLEGAYKQAYVVGEITLDDYYKYQQEVFKGLRDLFKDYLNDVEHEISMRSNYEGETGKIITLYEKMVSEVEKEIRNARVRGLNDTDDYVQELQSKWQNYTKEIKGLRKKVDEDAKQSTSNLVKMRISMIKDEINSEKESYSERLKMLKEFYEKQKKMLRDEADDEKYLEDQASKRKDITDIQLKLLELELDDSAAAQKKKIELAEELVNKQKDLANFEKDHALETTIEKLDEMYEVEEKAMDEKVELLDAKLEDAKGLYEQALNDIRNGSVSLYEEMIEWNNTHGDGIKETITEAWEGAYTALKSYRDLYGKAFDGFDLANATGYKPPTDSWNTSKISGQNASNKAITGSKAQTQSNLAKSLPGSAGTDPGVTKSEGSGSRSQTASKRSTSSSPALSQGKQVTVKKSATNFSAKSRGVRMYSYVPGGKYTVYSVAGGEVLIGRNGVYTGWVNKKDLVGYAGGTRSATPGIRQVFEQGREHIFESKNGNKYKLFSGGEKVLNARATDFLYDFAIAGSKMMSEASKIGSSGKYASAQSGAHITINAGDININGNANESTVHEIRQAQKQQTDFILKEFSRLNK